MLPLLAALSAAAAPPLAASPEVRWYTDHAVSRQIEEERAAATGLLSCCSGFVVFENSSFVCGPADPQSKDSWNRSTTPYLDTGLTVDHVISVPSVAKEDGVMRHGTMIQNWTRARPGIPGAARGAPSARSHDGKHRESILKSCSSLLRDAHGVPPPVRPGEALIRP